MTFGLTYLLNMTATDAIEKRFSDTCLPAFFFFFFEEFRHLNYKRQKEHILILHLVKLIFNTRYKQFTKSNLALEVQCLMFIVVTDDNSLLN